MDEYTCECLCLKVDRGITSEDVIDTLAELFCYVGLATTHPQRQWPEFIARAIQGWTKQLSIETLYIEPSSPWENGFAESFHSSFRDEFLASDVFENLAVKLTAAWKEDYNHYRPHSSLGDATPAESAGPLHRFRSEESFGYASALLSAPAVQRT